MHKLISANFWRLKKSKTFWGCLAVMTAYSVYFMASNGAYYARLAISYPERGYGLDSVLFGMSPLCGLVVALFAAVYLGVEYSDGTLRNKLIAGCARESIYLSNLTVLSAASLAVSGAYLLGGLAAVPFLGTWQAGAANFLAHLLVFACASLALAALFTLVGMLSPRRSTTMALCLLLTITLLAAASTIYSALQESEMRSDMMITVNGVAMADPTPNPRCVSGVLRKIYEALMYILPTGQTVRLANREIGSLWPELGASFAVFAAATGAGLFAFRRKDLR